ncbi:DUF6283 family protein [Streptomyces longispororuber]|uniref:DUF6283 family protein n=1 Tax=Streptomyces longispororuber TaxID=68230 RepID=UPI0033FBB423
MPGARGEHARRRRGRPQSRHHTLPFGALQEVRDYPCTGCPWRTDSDPSVFSEQEMDMLRRNSGRRGADASLTASAVGCHRDQRGTAHAWRWCAAWLATAGHYHHRVRLLHATDCLPEHCLDPQPGWPALYPDLDALLTARRHQLTQAAYAHCVGPRSPSRR